MKIGNRPKVGVRFEPDKWYYGLEIYKHHPSRWGIFKPCLFIYFYKITKEQFKEMDDFGAYKYTGFRKEFESPLGITFEIHWD